MAIFKRFLCSLLLVPTLLWANNLCSSEYLTEIGQKIDLTKTRINQQPHSKIILFQSNQELRAFDDQMDSCIAQFKKTIALLNESYAIIKTEQQNIEISYFKKQSQELEKNLKKNSQLLVLSQFLKSRIEQVQLQSQKQLYFNTRLFMQEKNTPFFKLIAEIWNQKLYLNIHFKKILHDNYYDVAIPHRLIALLIFIIIFFSIYALSHLKKYHWLKINLSETLIIFMLFAASQPIVYQIIKIDFSHSFDLFLKEYETLIVRGLGFFNLFYVLRYYKINNKLLLVLKVCLMFVAMYLAYLFILQANQLELNYPDLKQIILLYQYISYGIVLFSIYGILKWNVLQTVPPNLDKYMSWFFNIMFIIYTFLLFIALKGYLYFAFSITLSIFVITILIWWSITGLYITNVAIHAIYSEKSKIGKILNEFISLKKYHEKDISIIKTILFAGIIVRIAMLIWNNCYLSPGIYLKIRDEVNIDFNILGFSMSPLKLGLSICFFSFSRIIMRLMVRLFAKKFSTIKEFEYRVERTLYTIAITFTFFLALKIAGIELEHLAIIAGAVSFGIGVGLQDIMKNIISGILMMVYNPISKNDYIHVKEFRGYIKKFTLLTTQIETLDNTDVIIPNRYILDSILENFTFKNKKFHKIHLRFYLNNLEDFHRAKKVILKFLSTQKEVLLLDTSYVPSVLIHPENPNGIELEVICTLKQFEQEEKTISDLYLNIIPLLKNAKIAFQLNNVKQT